MSNEAVIKNIMEHLARDPETLRQDEVIVLSFKNNPQGDGTIMIENPLIHASVDVRAVANILEVLVGAMRVKGNVTQEFRISGGGMLQ